MQLAIGKASWLAKTNDRIVLRGFFYSVGPSVHIIQVNIIPFDNMGENPPKTIFAKSRSLGQPLIKCPEPGQAWVCKGPGAEQRFLCKCPRDPEGVATGQNDSRIRVHTNFQLATTNSLISITVLSLSDRPKVFRPPGKIGRAKAWGQSRNFCANARGTRGWRLVKMIAALEYIQIFNLLRPIV